MRIRSLLLGALLLSWAADVQAGAKCSGDPPYPDFSGFPSGSRIYYRCKVEEMTRPVTAPFRGATDISLAPISNTCANCRSPEMACTLEFTREMQAGIEQTVTASIGVLEVETELSVSFTQGVMHGCEVKVPQCKKVELDLGFGAHVDFSRRGVERLERRVCHVYRRRGGRTMWELLVADDFVGIAVGPWVSCGFDVEQKFAHATIGGTCKAYEGPYPCPDARCPECCDNKTGRVYEPVQTLAGSRLVLTGEVTAGETATLAVVGPQGNTMSGVVVEVDGQERTTGLDGRLSFVVSTGLTVLAARIVGLGADSAAHARVVPPSQPVGRAVLPAVASPRRFLPVGSEVEIRGERFSGEALDNKVRLRDRDLPVLASSPTQLLVSTPPDLRVGQTSSLSVTTAAGMSQAADVTCVRLRFEGVDLTLPRDRKGEAEVIVEGTDERVRLSLTNQIPQTLHLLASSAMPSGDDAKSAAASLPVGQVPWEYLEVRTKGGKTNSAKIHYRGVAAGPYLIQVKIRD